MSEEKKTYYGIQLDALNSIEKLTDKREYIKKIDFSKPLEEDNDANTIKEINVLKDLIDGGVLKETKPKKVGLELFGDKLLQANMFLKDNPFFYDKYKIWWVWNKRKFKYEIVDEVDILNVFNGDTKENIIKSKERTEIINSLKQVGRLNKPLEARKTWIQFNKLIYDIETGEVFEADPKYFITNPIEWELGTKEDTPTMDKIFEEWVGKDYVKTLYEVIAYSLLNYMPLHRIICLLGNGMNGKDTFLKLIEKFVGEDNLCSSDLDLLTQLNFESSKLYKKLVVVIGEVDKSVLKKTSMIKRIVGDSLMRVEFKGKDSFDTHLYAKPLIACNMLPETTDKSIGFYRRWCIIDFKNTFNEQKDILKEIPEQEYHNLTKKCIGVLKELLGNGTFTNEGTIQERMEKYEEHSNPIDNFLEEHTLKSFEGYIIFDNFYEKYVDYLLANGFRKQSKIEIGKHLRKNYDVKAKAIQDEHGYTTTKISIFGIIWK